MPGWGEESKASIERVYADLVRRFGEERAFRIANRNRNLVLFPNLVINDHISLPIRCTEPVAPDAMDVTVWGLAPEEEASNTVAVKRRLQIGRAHVCIQVTNAPLVCLLLLEQNK